MNRAFKSYHVHEECIDLPLLREGLNMQWQHTHNSTIQTHQNSMLYQKRAIKDYLSNGAYNFVSILITHLVTDF